MRDIPNRYDRAPPYPIPGRPLHTRTESARCRKCGRSDPGVETGSCPRAGSEFALDFGSPSGSLSGSLRAGSNPAKLPEGFGTRTDRSPGREKTGRSFPRRGGTYRATVRNPGRECGRLGGGVVAIMPRYGTYVTLSRAPRETAVFPVHCSPSSLPGRYASAAYTPVCGGTTGNMPRIPAGGVLRYASVCVGMVHL